MGGKLVKRKPFSSRLILTNDLNWTIGSLHDAVIWYKITHAGEQVPQWDFQNKGTRTSPHRPAFVLEVPLCNLFNSMGDFVPCDRIVQRVCLLNG